MSLQLLLSAILVGVVQSRELLLVHSKGMQQHFELGRILAKRYADFIGPVYAPENVYIRTTDYDRTVMSALSNMAGMFDGEPGVTIPHMDSWPGRWRPVSLFNIPRREDNILQISAACPLLEHYRHDLRDSPEFPQFWSENKELFAMIAKETQLINLFGGPKRDFYRGVYHGITDAILIQKDYDLPVPDWVTDDVFHRMENASRWWFYFNFHPPNVNKYVGGGGSLVQDMLRRWNQKVACDGDDSLVCGDINNLKYYVYSAHDTTVGAFTEAVRSFSVLEKGLPGYTGCILTELWKEDDGTFSVEAFYRQNPAGKAHDTFEPIALFDCPAGQPCPLTVFQEKAVSRMPGDWEAECRTTLPGRKKRTTEPQPSYDHL